MNRQKRSDSYKLFIHRIVSKINLVSLELGSLEEIGEISSKYGLDFDDSYQYIIAKKLDLKIVSFDKDFDKTDLKRIEP